MANNNKHLGLTRQELIDVDTQLRRLSEVLEFAERLQRTGTIDLTETIVGIQHMQEALTRMKVEFAPNGTVDSQV